MTETIRIGVVGTSWWADMHHLPYLKSHPGAEVAAVCGRNRDRAEAIAGKFQISGIFTDYREMIEKGDLQALVVAAPDNVHYDAVMAALDAGLHVVCEKPMAKSVAQAGEMYAKAAEKGVKNMTYFTWRFLPHFRYVKRLVDDGFLGNCYHSHFQWFQGAGRGPGYHWHFDRERGSGVLGDLGSHMLDFARWLVGDIAAVGANLKTFIDRQPPESGRLIPADDSAMLLLDFESGAQGTVHVSAVSHIGGRMWDQRMLLHGEAGSIEVTSTIAGTAISVAKDGDREFKSMEVPDEFWDKADKANPFSVFTSQSVGARLFVDSIIEDRPITPGFKEGLEVQKVLDAAVASNEQGAKIKI
ncbi:MAG: Gfo/Idh/MocA family oxidoreductase [bacterium]|nr:Gfo/Idh/MocA family oxidoreductase [bacterium]